MSISQFFVSKPVNIQFLILGVLSLILQSNGKHVTVSIFLWDSDKMVITLKSHLPFICPDSKPLPSSSYSVLVLQVRFFQSPITLSPSTFYLLKEGLYCQGKAKIVKYTLRLYLGTRGFTSPPKNGIG